MVIMLTKFCLKVLGFKNLWCMKIKLKSCPYQYDKYLKISLFSLSREKGLPTQLWNRLSKVINFTLFPSFFGVGGDGGGG